MNRHTVECRNLACGTYKPDREGVIGSAMHAIMQDLKGLKDIPHGLRGCYGKRFQWPQGHTTWAGKTLRSMMHPTMQKLEGLEDLQRAVSVIQAPPSCGASAGHRAGVW
eukprot:1156162-Pelagomonas_calceolata.AAC.2